MREEEYSYQKNQSTLNGTVAREFFHQTVPSSPNRLCLQPFIYKNFCSIINVLKSFPSVRDTGEMRFSSVRDTGKLQIAGVPDASDSWALQLCSNCWCPGHQ